MGTSAARSGTLEEGQVRAMFDRIAGFYDVMNSVMTAGLHHRWRERAADLARVGPGDRALDVATGTGDLALELSRRVRPGGEVVGSDFSEGMLERARAKAGGEPRACAGSGATRSSCPTRTSPSTPRRSASAPATSPTSSAAWRRWRASCARAGAWSCSRSRRRRARRCRRSSRSGSTASCRRSGASAADSEAYTYLPSSVKRFPAPTRWPPALARAGLTDVRWILTAGGIIALHSGTVTDGLRRVRRRRHRGGRRPRPGADRAPRGAPGRGRRVARAGARRARRWRRSPPAASACARCSCSWPPGPARRGRGAGSCAPRWPSS